ncbi:MAG: hypothetical protein RIT81_12165 [Deltaproteobacteria bacterium]
MTIKADNAPDPVRLANEMLAQFQSNVARAGVKGKDPDAMTFDKDAFEIVASSVSPEFAELRSVLGARLDLYDLEASAVPNPRGGGWFLRLEDAKGQQVDFRVDRGDLSEIRGFLHDHAGLGYMNVQLDNEEGIQQLARLIATATVSPDFKAKVPLAARYVGDVRRALVPSAKKQTARAVLALNNALQGAAQGSAADMEKLITAYIELGFSFRKFNKVYGDSDKESLSIEFADKNGNEVRFEVEAIMDDENDRVKGHECKMSWSVREQKNNATAPNNANQINEWIREFGIKDAGSNNNSNGTREGERSLDRASEKKFVVELMQYAKNRKWVTIDTSKGSLGRHLKL